MTANCLLSGAGTLRWYMGVALLDVMREARVLN
jgi:hypothetical protein